MKKMIIFSVAPLILTIVIIIVMCASPSSSAAGDGLITVVNVSEEVLQYKPLVEKYCKKYEISEYVNYILAIMMVESAGKGSDVMYSSESLGLSPGTLTPEKSIEQGCKVFSEHLKTAQDNGCDVDTALQAYNYGGSFITYVSEQGKKYSFYLAEQFAKEKSNGEKVAYLNEISNTTNGGWKYVYGNMFYVKLVKQYLVASSNLGSYALQFVGENHTRFTSYNGKNSQAFAADWCAMFVSYCCDQMGYIDAGYIDWYNACSIDSYISSGKWHYSYYYGGNYYTPSAGDIIFFTQDYGVTGSHTGIVTACDGETISTVEGNTGSVTGDPYWQYSYVAEHSYSIKSNYIWGYVPLSQIVKVGV